MLTGRCCQGTLLYFIKVPCHKGGSRVGERGGEVELLQAPRGGGGGGAPLPNGEGSGEGLPRNFF